MTKDSKSKSSNVNQHTDKAKGQKRTSRWEEDNRGNKSSRQTSQRGSRWESAKETNKGTIIILYCYESVALKLVSTAIDILIPHFEYIECFYLI